MKVEIKFVIGSATYITCITQGDSLAEFIAEVKRELINNDKFIKDQLESGNRVKNEN